MIHINKELVMSNDPTNAVPEKTSHEKRTKTKETIHQRLDTVTSMIKFGRCILVGLICWGGGGRGEGKCANRENTTP